ncbi:DUF6333 family protein [Streptomyces sp. NPDC058469]|uniref:DUF6333 family protein n=1 Tax=Streptomyces sp. NPDC058469 TaxID=3346514 RepID=UPI00364B7BE9
MSTHERSVGHGEGARDAGDQTDRAVAGHAHPVVVHPPFAYPLRPDERPPATAQDAEAARAAVLSLSSVAAIRREKAPSRLGHPDARIVAVCERDFGAAYLKILVAMPGAPDLAVEGFDELAVTGDLRAMLAAAGIDPELLGEDEEFGGEGLFDYDGPLHVLTGGALSFYADEERLESAFVVDRGEEGEGSIGEVWFPWVPDTALTPGCPAKPGADPRTVRCPRSVRPVCRPRRPGRVP